jgi:hypothetical protein
MPPDERLESPDAPAEAEPAPAGELLGTDLRGDGDRCRTIDGADAFARDAEWTPNAHIHAHVDARSRGQSDARSGAAERTGRRASEWAAERGAQRAKQRSAQARPGEPRAR